MRENVNSSAQVSAAATAYATLSLDTPVRVRGMHTHARTIAHWLTDTTEVGVTAIKRVNLTGAAMGVGYALFLAAIFVVFFPIGLIARLFRASPSAKNA